MNRLSTKSVVGLLATVCVIVSPYALATSAADANGPVHVLTDLQFSSTTMSKPGWTFGSKNGGSLLVSTTTPPPVAGDSSYALEAEYPATTTGGQYTWADYSVASLNTEDIYVEFWAKMPSPAKEGLKFLKIFGKNSDPQGYANTTLAPSYNGGVNQGAFFTVGFGDGSTTTNDFENVIRMDGSYPNWIGRSYGIAKVLTPQMSSWPSSNWGTSWHHFKMHVKFNSGTTSSNEVPNGEVYVEIDGKVYVDATGLYNRNPANGPIDRVEFGGWAQSDPSSFTVWYDNITISTGGFASDPPPNAPTNVAVN